MGIIDSNTRDMSSKVDYMFKKKIKMLICDCDRAIFLVTEEGEVYHWWDVPQKDFHINYYSQMIDLKNKHIVLTAAGGKSTFIMLTDDGEVYYFHLHQSGHGSFEWMKQMKHLKKKVICLSCGDGFFVVITEDNKVHSWGKNDCGQLGISTTGNFIAKPKEVKILNDSKIKIVKVACGYTHTLALTETGEVYAWGGNIYGELNLDKNVVKNNPSPVKVSIHSPTTILDITAMKNMSGIIGEDKRVYLWGLCFDQQINTPTAFEYTTLFDMCNALCARPPTSVKYHTNEKFKILKDLRTAFNDSTTSDFVIKVEEQKIYVHKIILQFRSSYFNNKFQSDQACTEIVLKEFPYAIYNAYLKYLYSGIIDISLEEKFDLLKLACKYEEKKLEKSCRRMIKKEMTEENVIFIYKIAKEREEYCSEFVEYCFDFFKENSSSVMETNSFAELDTKSKNIFLKQLPPQENILPEIV